MDYFVITPLENKTKEAKKVIGLFLYYTSQMLGLMEMLIERGLINNELTSILLEGYLEEEIEDGEFDLPRMVYSDELILYEETGRNSAMLTYMKFKDFYPILEREIHNRFKPQKDSYWDISKEDQVKILRELANVKTSFGLDD